MLCPECKSSMCLRKTTNNHPGTGVKRRYYCKSCGTAVETQETIERMKKPANAPSGMPLRRQPKHPMLIDLSEGYEPVPDNKDVPVYKGY